VPTVFVAPNGRYVGNGSKQDILNYNNANVIMQVQSNIVGGYSGESAIIENLIIDGHEQSGTVGILLQNVCNCIIRNLTILNCDVGIKIENTNSYQSRSNRIEHIRMTNVKQGILFVGTNNARDFSFTTIEDVGIKLRDDCAEGAGIQIGESGGPILKPYNSFIKTTVWLGSDSGCGMNIYGELKYSLVMLAVEGTNNGGTGVGIQTNQDYAVYHNQSFTLAHGKISTPISQQAYLGHHDIVEKPL
jgi:hypothetical protein